MDGIDYMAGLTRGRTDFHRRVLVWRGTLRGGGDGRGRQQLVVAPVIEGATPSQKEYGME